MKVLSFLSRSGPSETQNQTSNPLSPVFCPNLDLTRLPIQLERLQCQCPPFVCYFAKPFMHLFSSNVLFYLTQPIAHGSTAISHLTCVMPWTIPSGRASITSADSFRPYTHPESRPNV